MYRLREIRLKISILYSCSFANNNGLLSIPTVSDVIFNAIISRSENPGTTPFLGTFPDSYNENGQMTHWECQDPDYPNYNECCNIFYDGNGDITRIYPSYGDNKTFVYVNDSVTSPIENKGGIMLLSDWNIMGDWEYYYWFGIYGKATKHLPVKVGDDTYNWTLDKKGYPTSCKVETDEYVWTYCFEWE